MKRKIPLEVLKQLKYVQVKRKIDLNHFPNFLILGPQRTGSTWLAENLRVHPEIFFTTPKELYFFNLLGQADNYFYNSSKLEWYSGFFKDSPIQYLRKNLVCLKRHGEFFKPKVRGEGTASYAAMGQHLIKEIVALNPDIKAIMIVRNPIIRAWSHAKKDLLNISFMNKTPRNISDVPEQEFINFFHDQYQIRCGNYHRNIAKWSSLLKKGHLLTLCFDDIAIRPLELLIKVFDFLGVDNNPNYVESSVSLKRYEVTDRKTKKRELPTLYKEVLFDLFSESLGKMEERFGRPLTR